MPKAILPRTGSREARALRLAGLGAPTLAGIRRELARPSLIPHRDHALGMAAMAAAQACDRGAPRAGFFDANRRAPPPGTLGDLHALAKSERSAALRERHEALRSLSPSVAEAFAPRSADELDLAAAKALSSVPGYANLNYAYLDAAGCGWIGPDLFLALSGFMGPRGEIESRLLALRGASRAEALIRVGSWDSMAAIRAFARRPEGALPEPGLLATLRSAPGPRAPKGLDRGPALRVGSLAPGDFAHLGPFRRHRRLWRSALRDLETVEEWGLAPDPRGGFRLSLGFGGVFFAVSFELAEALPAGAAPNAPRGRRGSL